MVQENLLKRALRLSIALHTALLLTLAIREFLLPVTPREYLPSLRVDLVGLPENKRNVLPVPAATPAAVTAPPAPAAQTAEIPTATDKGDLSIVKKKSKSKKEKEAQKRLKQALDRIRAIERIKMLAGGDEVKGNSVSKGSALTGEAKQALETSYFDVILERVRTYWELPKWLQGQNRSAKVMIYLDGQGQLRSFQFVQVSGSESFDSEVKRTLQAAAPFPVPPAALASDISKQGILLGFPL
jgi:outer membrane biosynthesis protein TonB